MGCPGEQTRGNRLQEKLTQATRVHDRDNQRRGEQNIEGLHHPVQQYPKGSSTVDFSKVNTPAGVTRHRWSHA